MAYGGMGAEDIYFLETEVKLPGQQQRLLCNPFVRQHAQYDSKNCESPSTEGVMSKNNHQMSNQIRHARCDEEQLLGVTRVCTPLESL